MKEIIITSQEEGQRLDRLLQRYLSNASSGFLYKMLRKKNITLNGRKADGTEKLVQGDTIRLFFADETLRKFTGQTDEARYPQTNLDIVYEDDHILLVNKPAGMLSQKAEPSDVSLNEYAIGYLLHTGAVTPESLAVVKPSVCNRLDRNTSGIVAVGKSSAGLRELSAMFRDRTVHKFYLTLVIGRIDREAVIDGILFKDEKTNMVTVKKMEESMDSDPAGQRICTRYVPVAHRSDSDVRHELTLLEVELITGRSHQIRAHLSSTGHPVVGDPKYGSSRRNDYFRREYDLRGQFLHAARIVFPQMDGTLSYLSGRQFTAPLPGKLARIIEGEHLS